MPPPLRPIYLFADSQSLFWKTGDRLFLESVKDTSLGREPRAAYIGASNDDAPEEDESIEAIRHPLHDFAFVQGALTSGLLLPAA